MNTKRYFVRWAKGLFENVRGGLYPFDVTKFDMLKSKQFREVKERYVVNTGNIDADIGPATALVLESMGIAVTVTQTQYEYDVTLLNLNSIEGHTAGLHITGVSPVLYTDTFTVELEITALTETFGYDSTIRLTVQYGCDDEQFKSLLRQAVLHKIESFVKKAQV